MEHTCTNSTVSANNTDSIDGKTENNDCKQVVLNGGKHVMLSYNWNSQTIVSKIYQILKDENIPIWFDIQGDMKDNIYERYRCSCFNVIIVLHFLFSMADGIENAAIVCCFMTPDYQKSENCKLELQYAKKRGKRIIPCMLGDKGWQPSTWLGLITAGYQYINFRDVSAENVRLKTGQLIDRIKEQPGTSQPVDEPSYLFDLIRLEYQRNSRIERIMNPTKFLSIEQSYINLAIVETTEQQEKERKLRDAQNNGAIIGTFEQIYGVKSVIDVKDIFNKCKDQTKNILVLGRAGIGKSTFCQYVAYKWATGAIWSQYDLLVMIPLRSLTESRYPPLPPGTNYTLIDLVKKEYFGYGLSEKDDELLREQFGKSRILWLLDGYDEIVQNVPGHLKYVFEQLLKTPHHIITSRPYLNTLSYTVQLEITGFTDDNIAEYVKQFFDQTGDTTSVDQKLLSFLKLNPSIWGVAHIPINLELICSIWCDTDWSETKTLTITALYDSITEWLCRRYLTKQNVDIQMTKEDIYADCQKELTFLETLAFKGMENNTIILRKDLLQKTFKETDYSSKHYARLLNIGILKSINDQSIGNKIEVQKDHYFIHLSFQEHFAARYLVKALNGPGRQTAIEFIQTHKYNQRFQLVFIFTSGLLIQTDTESCVDTFWEIILGEPLDLVGLRHTQLIMSCMEETMSSSHFHRRTELMDSITKAIITAVSMKHDIIYRQLQEPLRRSTTLVDDSTIQNTLIKLLESEELSTKRNVLTLISQLPISNPSSQLIHLLLLHVGGEHWYIRKLACNTLENIGEKAANDDVMNKLMAALQDESSDIRASACSALRKMGEKATATGVINSLMTALEDANESVRRESCEALGEISKKVTINDVRNRIVAALGDKSTSVRQKACEVLGKMGGETANNEVINALVSALGDDDTIVKRKAREALNKMAEKATTNDIINRLATALGDKDVNVRRRACIALADLAEKAATNDIINRLVTAVGDDDGNVREKACKVLEQMGEKTATDDVINRLVTALEDENGNVRWRACEALRKMGEKAPINYVINGLLIALRHERYDVRQDACKALGEISEKIVTVDMINGLANALKDEYSNVQEVACEALGKMGEKAATDDVINGLITVLGNFWPDTRENAWNALEKMGEKATTSNIINTLLVALKDDDWNVATKACRALGKIWEKAPTNDIINRLLAVLADADEREHAKECACQVLGQMGEKAATNDIINGLVTALGDKLANVRRQACSSLGEIGEKAATNKVISGLVTALNDKNSNVTSAACEALGRMGKNAATDEVIAGLVTALGSEDDHGKRAVCKSLGKIGEKAATNDVIHGLVIALQDESMFVSETACEVIGEMGEKAATNDVINGLLGARDRVIGSSSANGALEKILLSFSGLTQLSSDTISKLFEKISAGIFGTLRTLPPDQFIKVFLHTKNAVWLRIVTVVALLQGNAVTVTGNTIVIYGSQEQIQIPVANEELRQELIEAFAHQTEELQSSSDLLAKSNVVSSVCSLM